MVETIRCEKLDTTDPVTSSIKVGDIQYNCNITYAYCKPLVCAAEENYVNLTYFRPCDNFRVEDIMPDVKFVSLVQDTPDVCGERYDGYAWEAEDFIPDAPPVKVSAVVSDIVWDVDDEAEAGDVPVDTTLNIECTCAYYPEEATDSDPARGWDTDMIVDAVTEQTGYCIKSCTVEVLTDHPKPKLAILDHIPSWALQRLSLKADGTWCTELQKEDKGIVEAGYAVLGERRIKVWLACSRYKEEYCKKKAQEYFNELCRLLSPTNHKYTIRYIMIRPDGSLYEANQTDEVILESSIDDHMMTLACANKRFTGYLLDELEEDVAAAYENGVEFTPPITVKSY